MAEEKFAVLTRDPENGAGHDILREKYSLPKPNTFKYGRSQGGISNVELEKLGVGTVRPNKVFQPKRILPKNFRDDPFADPPPITENDIKDGMYSLLNRGIIPRDVDLTPAFERGKAPFTHQQAALAEQGVQKPKQLQHKVVPGPIKYVRRRKQPGMDNQLPDPEVLPDPSLHRDNVFLTSMNVEDHDVLRTTRQTNLRGGEHREEDSAMHGFEVRQSHDSRLRRGRGPSESPRRAG